MAYSVVRFLKSGPYLVHPHKVGTIVETVAVEQPWLPAVLLSLPQNKLNVEGVESQLSEFARVDNMFSEDFRSTLIMQSIQDQHLHNAAEELVSSGHFGAVYMSVVAEKQHQIPQGPYFINGQAVHQAWKLYEDDLGVFVIPTIPNDVLSPKRFSVLQAVSQHGSFQSIAVPSRLYFTRTTDKPLAGLRISIKDNYDLEGIRTTMTNRAYNELYHPRSSSADYIVKLIGLGAVIVGKTKMSAFASAEDPTDQWIDYHCPVNPRGDMYQTPSCSSTGAGASLAGYAWLDHAIGSDTSGSIRLPAAFNGLVGLRTSYGINSKRGIVPSCNEFDTVGTLHRSLQDAKDFITATMDVPDSTEYPKRLLYPLNFFPQEDEAQHAMTEEFITASEKYLGVERTPISISDTWNAAPPSEAGGKSLQQFLEMSAVWPMYYDTYHTFDDFRREYQEKFGKPAFVGPYMRTRWGIAVPFTKEERRRGVEEMQIFRAWFEEHIMGRASDGITDAVMFMPFGSAQPKYRDDPNKLPSIVCSFSVFYLPAVLQFPTLVVPIGQKLYHSRVSDRDEYLPGVSSFMGAKGSDVLLINLAKSTLDNAGWPSSVKTGREMFDIGDNVRNV